jgi:hypothetical protein
MKNFPKYFAIFCNILLLLMRKEKIQLQKNDNFRFYTKLYFSDTGVHGHTEESIGLASRHSCCFKGTVNL